MGTLEALKSRRAVRNWTDQEIPEDILIQVLEAGRWAPSPLNSHPWRFIVIRNQETLNMLVPEAHHGSFISKANTVVAVTVDNKAKVDEWLAEHDQHIYSGACAIENMWLAATDLGLGGCWVSLDEKSAKETLSIPDDQKLIGSLALGYPAEAPRPHQETDRKPLSEIVVYESYGNKA